MIVKDCGLYLRSFFHPGSPDIQLLAQRWLHNRQRRLPLGSPAHQNLTNPLLHLQRPLHLPSSIHPPRLHHNTHIPHPPRLPPRLFLRHPRLNLDLRRPHILSRVGRLRPHLLLRRPAAVAIPERKIHLPENRQGPTEI